MSTNPSHKYNNAQKAYLQAKTDEEKISCLKELISTAPKHKSSENLLADLKTRLKKLKDKIKKEKKQQKTRGHSLSVKKEGAAQVTLVGTTNSGKSTLLHELTGAQVTIAEYPFTTKKPEVGTMDYKGVKIQIVEVPAIVEDYEETTQGPAFLSIVKHTDLVVLLFKTPQEKKLLDEELYDVHKPKIIYNNQKDFKEKIWKKLGLIKVYTKQQGKEKDYPPIAFEHKATVKDVAKKVHKDFLKRFRFARIFGTSVKFNGAQVGLDHILEDEDIVELHMR